MDSASGQIAPISRLRVPSCDHPVMASWREFHCIGELKVLACYTVDCNPDVMSTIGAIAAYV
jgi:hypothetical protein